MIQDNLKIPQKKQMLQERTKNCWFKISWVFCSTNRSEATPTSLPQETIQQRFRL